MMLVGLCFQAVAQNVPSSVEGACKKKYPQAEDVEWEKKGNNYEASFVHDDENILVSFDGKGTLLETCLFVENESVPEAVVDAVNAKYPDSYFSQSMECKDAKGAKTYTINVDADDASFVVKVDAKGKLLKSDKLASQSEDEE